MEFTNEFRVPSDVDTTFATLVDLERVAPCMPGAVLESVDGQAYAGRMNVRVGPIRVQYRGIAELVEVAPDAQRIAIRAAGQEDRGAGTASADVVATMCADDGETVVTVVTDLNVTGKPAQFGRGVMAEVGAKIIGQFAERLEGLLQEEEQQPGQVPARDAPPGGDALDLVDMAATATLKRLAPVATVLTAVAGVIWWLARR